MKGPDPGKVTAGLRGRSGDPLFRSGFTGTVVRARGRLPPLDVLITPLSRTSRRAGRSSSAPSGPRPVSGDRDGNRRTV